MSFKTLLIRLLEQIGSPIAATYPAYLPTCCG